LRGYIGGILGTIFFADGIFFRICILEFLVYVTRAVTRIGFCPVEIEKSNLTVEEISCH